MDQAEQPGPEKQANHRPRSASLSHPVVVGYDGSASSRHALAYVAGMGRRLGRPLLVAYVTKRPTGTAPAPLRLLLAELDGVAELEVQVRTRRGRPARELAALAAELHADALVTGAPMRLRQAVA